MLQRSYGWIARDIGVTMGLVVPIGGCAGVAPGVTISDRLPPRGHRDAARKVAAVRRAAPCLAFLALLATHGSPLRTVINAAARRARRLQFGIRPRP